MHILVAVAEVYEKAGSGAVKLSGSGRLMIAAQVVVEDTRSIVTAIRENSATLADLTAAIEQLTAASERLAATQEPSKRKLAQEVAVYLGVLLAALAFLRDVRA